MTGQRSEDGRTWAAEAWRTEAWWCPSGECIVMCPGPCPDGRKHLLLPPCEACDGTGMVNVEPCPNNPNGWIAEKCPTCDGHAALPHIGRHNADGDAR